MMVHTSGNASQETLLDDSSLCTYNQYVWKKNDNSGRRERLTTNDCVAELAVTDSDLPMLLKLTKTAPTGNRYLIASTVAKPAV